MSPRRSVPVVPRALLGLAGLGLLAHLVHNVLKVGVPGEDLLVSRWVHLGVLVAATALCALRVAYRSDERLAWAVIGAGVGAWTVGEFLWKLHYSQLADPPFPSPCDALWLLFYPAAYVGLLLLVRSRVERFHASVWLDGVIGALAAASVGAALALQPILDATHGPWQTVATNLAYPAGDLLLLACVVGVFALTGWRPGRAWLLLGLGLAAMAVADTSFLYKTAAGTWVDGSDAVDALWPAGLLLVAAAGWAPTRRTIDLSLDGWRLLVLPLGFLSVALGLLALDRFRPITPLALVLALLTVVVTAVRWALTLREHQRLLVSSEREALTDALTELGNRRALTQDLDGLLRGPGLAPRALALFDLDGFKHYNDSFGHPAGDALLIRLARNLERVISPYGSAYRIGGDEFCALVDPAAGKLEAVLAGAREALGEHGEGFVVGTSIGVVVLPREAASAGDALTLADCRLYADKDCRRGSPGRQTSDALLQALAERLPGLRLHLDEVAERARGVARRLGLNGESVDEVTRAAELHDVGQVGLPEAILHKPGELDPEEWAFMRRQTLIGERVLLAAPALAPVARLVRSSHERWDGDGYPDGLAGEAIPLGARIVAVCDAWDAMISGRPYRAALTAHEALRELERGAGTQFDPAVVEAFRAGTAMAVAAPPPVLQS